MRTEKHFITQSPNNGANHYGLDTSIKVHFSNAVPKTDYKNRVPSKSLQTDKKLDNKRIYWKHFYQSCESGGKTIIKGAVDFRSPRYHSVPLSVMF